MAGIRGAFLEEAAFRDSCSPTCSCTAFRFREQTRSCAREAWVFLRDLDAVRTGDSPSRTPGDAEDHASGSGRRGRRQSRRLHWLLGWLASSLDHVTASPQARKDELRSSPRQKAAWQVGILPCGNSLEFLDC